MNDWKKLLNEIIKAGYTQAEIARQLGIKPPSVNEILTDERQKDLRWTTGNRLIALHKRVMRNARKKSA